jgi:hypothetical protein
LIHITHGSHPWTYTLVEKEQQPLKDLDDMVHRTTPEGNGKVLDLVPELEDKSDQDALLDVISRYHEKGLSLRIEIIAAPSCSHN